MTVRLASQWSLGSLVILSFPVTVIGAPALDEASNQSPVGAVVIYGQHAAITTQQQTVIERDDIEALGARSLDEALQQQASIQLRIGGNGTPRLFVRGVPPRHTPIFLNGIALNSAIDGQFDPSLIASESLARIDIIKANASVLYGPGTTGGVIDLITRRPTRNWEVSAAAQAGTGDSRWLSGYLGHAYQTGSLLLSASHQQRDAYPVVAAGDRQNSDRRRDSVFASWQQALGALTVGTSGGYFNGQQGIAPSTIPASAGNVFAQSQQFERLDAEHGKYAQVDLRYAATDWAARLSAYGNWLDLVDNRYDDANYNSMSNASVKTFHQLIDSRVQGAQLQLNREWGPGEALLMLGTRAEREVLAGYIRDVPVTGGGGGGGGNRSGTFAVRNLSNQYQLQTHWAALEYNWVPTAHWQATLGAGNAWFHASGVTQVDAQAMAGLKYQINGDWTAHASYAHKTRYATLQELFDVTRGNVNLRPERADSFEVGARWQLHAALSLPVTLFWNHLADFIQNDAATQLFVNRGQRVQGIEVAPRWQWRQVTVTGSYTYLQATDDSTGLKVDSRPRSVSQLSVDYVFNPQWQWRAWASYVADQVVSANNNPSVQQQMPDYGLVSMRAVWQSPWRVAVHLQADNLFNKAYSYTPGLPGAGRSLLLGVNGSW